VSYISRRKKIIDMLRKMGYDVVENEFDNEVQIRLTTNKGYGVLQRMSNEVLYEPDIVETIVNRMNDLIKRHL